MLSNFQVTKAEIKSRMTMISGLNWIKHLEVLFSAEIFLLVLL